MTKTTFITEPGKQEIVMMSAFDAPRELVFKAMTDPNLIPRWWGPKRYKTTVEKSVFQSVEDRDGMLSTDMEAGGIETMERLATLLAEA